MTALAAPLDLTRLAPERSLSAPAKKIFKTWTASWIIGTLTVMVLFYIGTLDFVMSGRLSMYLISVWLNAWILVWLFRRYAGQEKSDLWHDLMVVWMVSYAITNIQWEIPWVILSPIIFENMHTLDDLVAQTGYMREAPWHLYYWVIASFGAVDLRTINHDGTFYSLEMFAFVNLAMTFYFFHLNKKRSPYRYLIVVLGCGEPIAATFIFSFSEVFDGFVNMPGGLWDTLLALVWTQYQYVVFPMIFGVVACKLLLEDLAYCKGQ